MAKLSALFLILTILASANAVVLPRDDSGITVTVESDQVFCSFLPPQPGGNIGASEGDAIAFCTTSSPNAPGAKIFPQGFINTSHFHAEGSYVQVTGTINIGAYSLDPNDGGGQYDSVGAPPNAVCHGYKKFVNLIEPDIGLFCIRCCQNSDDCDTGHSTDGCQKVIPGDYS